MRNKGRTQFLSADMSAKVGETDFSIYNKFGGYRRGQNTKKLSKEQMAQIDDTLPGPHNPSALGELFLKGTSKLLMEEQVARKSSHLMILNNAHNVAVMNRLNVNLKTSFIEQQADSVWFNTDID